jgi:hypothetical protein
MFITVITRALHLFLSLARPIQSTTPHPTSPRSILILSTHLRLGLPSGLFPSGFPTNNLYAFLFSPNRATWPAHLILHDLVIVIILSFLVSFRRTCGHSHEFYDSINGEKFLDSGRTHWEHLPKIFFNPIFICNLYQYIEQIGGETRWLVEECSLEPLCK